MASKLSDTNISIMSTENLIEVIDFFSQSLSVEQLIHYGLEVVHKSLDLNKAAIFIKEGDHYELKETKNWDIEGLWISRTDKLKTLATKVGRILSKDFDEYFEQSVLELYEPKMVIPLIIKDELAGFILSDGKGEESHSQAELNVAYAVMRLMNGAYETARSFNDLEVKNKNLDKKIFNLFFLNQCSKSLLEQLELDKIYDICIDVIRELTSSTVTTFGMYDEIRDKIVIKGYKDIVTFDSYYTEIQLKESYSSPTKVIYHCKSDQELLKEFFVDPERFSELKAEYVVLIVKDKIKGFVSIGRAVNDRVYDNALLELVENVASSIYISITNAIQFKKIKEQKEIIKEKYKVMIALSKAIKNINSCDNVDELCQITMQTLQYAFDIVKGGIIMYEGDQMVVKSTVGLPDQLIGDLDHSVSEKLSNVCDLYFEYTGRNIEKYFSNDWVMADDESNCLVMAPIRLDKLSLPRHGILGYIVIFGTKAALKQEEVVLFDTIANSIAPILNQMQNSDEVMTHYMIDPQQAMLDCIYDKLNTREQYYIDFSIYYKEHPVLLFEKPTTLQIASGEQFQVGNYRFVVSDEALNMGDYDGKMVITDMDDFYDQVKLLNPS